MTMTIVTFSKYFFILFKAQFCTFKFKKGFVIKNEISKNNSFVIIVYDTRDTRSMFNGVLKPKYVYETFFNLNFGKSLKKNYKNNTKFFYYFFNV